ncbi:hypothetical protein PHMEG_00012171 [Phytophthora megakarya]|uniref:Uncharacterized protein n=1 Tax=Phytophthora megakarya TaxID=4795 RepID=A0A225W9E4_9STRA|nr:hypothetical protein PHMEG_00012171 [Phytophthora megakarya]
MDVIDGFALLRKGSRCASARTRFSHQDSTMLGSLRCSPLGPPMQIPREFAMATCARTRSTPLALLFHDPPFKTVHGTTFMCSDSSIVLAIKVGTKYSNMQS